MNIKMLLLNKITFLLFIFSGGICVSAVSQNLYSELYRPQIHFTPKSGWMNDPNGLVFFDNQYHLFYQHYPNSSVWGPMHWGHATSRDLMHWQQQPVALYPDSLGYIFSGSVVADVNNTSGFGKEGQVPLVAIFTHHDMAGEKAGRNDFQVQSLAYSLDKGFTWIKYSNNPVIRNPGIRDFRDPKVSWFEPGKKWIMTLATFDRVTFYSSTDLKSWSRESDFGGKVGAHSGAWECPDLFSLDYQGEKIWVLLASINPGGPNGGSATQYFTGKFDGKTFTSTQTDIRWLDYGTDNYAGITWSNTGNRKIFIGWMSNWQYARSVPTYEWRSAMTVPRELGIEKVGGKYLVTSLPVQELGNLTNTQVTEKNFAASGYDLTKKTGKLAGPVKIIFSSGKIETFAITLSNDKGEKVVLGFDKAANHYFADRSQSGRIDFEKDFGSFHYAPRLSDKPNVNITLIIDNASVEFFADNGLTVMTEIFFANETYSRLHLQAAPGFMIQSLSLERLKNIWKEGLVRE